MHRKNKKAQIVDGYAILVGFLIISLGGLLYFGFTMISARSAENYFESRLEDIHNSDQLISMLKAEIESETMLDSIIRMHYEGVDEPTVASFDSFFEKLYSTKVCWEIYKGESKWIEKNSCRTDEKIVDSTINIPLQDKEIIKLRLNIKGYT